MVTSLARGAGTISIDPAEERCDRNPAPREGPRHWRRVRSVTTTDESNGADGFGDMEGKVTRVGASERGKRTSFNPEREARLSV